MLAIIHAGQLHGATADFPDTRKCSESGHVEARPDSETRTANGTDYNAFRIIAVWNGFSQALVLLPSTGTLKETIS